MKLTVNRSDLHKALSHAAAIVEKRDLIAILCNVLIEAEGETVRITATDLDLQISLSISAKVETEGATTVSGHLLHNIVREIAEGHTVDLWTEQMLHVVSGRSRWKMQTIRHEDFPRINAGDLTTRFSLPARSLLRMLRQVGPAQFRDGVTRPFLCGVRLECRDKELFAVATDTTRLAFAKTKAPNGIDDLGVTLPTKFVTELVKLLDCDGDVTLAVSERLACADIGDAVLTGKLVNGSFPDWRRIVPTTNGRRLLTHREAFAGAIRRASAVANEKTRVIKIDLSRDRLTV